MDDSLTSFWNKKYLSPPSIASRKIESIKPDVVGFRLGLCLERILSDCSCLPQLNVEGAAISRLVYRFKRKLRSDKGFKAMQKINHMLLNYLKMDFTSVFEQIKNCIYEESGPSHEVLEWGLVSILRLASLFNKLYLTCMDGARYIRDRFASGDFWVVASICLASVSRVWVLSQHLVKLASNWYRELKAFLPYMNSSGLDWSPENFSLPPNLPIWLKEPAYLAQQPTKRKRTTSDPFEDDLEFNPNVEVEIKHKSLVLTEDLGESVSRDTGEVIKKKSKVNEITDKKANGFKAKSNQSLPCSLVIEELLNAIKCKNDLIEFMCREGILREIDGSESVTKHLPLDTWVEMKESLTKHIKRIDEAKNVKMKLKNARKCIQYYVFHALGSER